MCTCFHAEGRFLLETRSCLSTYEPFTGEKSLFRVELVVEFSLKLNVEFSALLADRETLLESCVEFCVEIIKTFEND